MRGDVTKLPKWAQQEIGRLERDLEDARRRLSEGPMDSNTFADPYSESPRPLGRDTLIEFRAGETFGERFRVYLRDGVLEVGGGDGVAVLPRASNVVEIKLSKF